MGGDIFNVGGDKQISIEELANLIRNLVNSNVKIIVKKQNNKNVLPERYVPDITFAKNKLGLFPTISLEESIESTAKWFLERTKK